MFNIKYKFHQVRRRTFVLDEMSQFCVYTDKMAASGSLEADSNFNLPGSSG